MLFFYILNFFLISLSFSANGEAFLYRSSNSEPLSLEITRDIFEGQKLSWNNGKSIVLVLNELEQIDDSKFSSFTNLSKSQFLSKWRIKFFSGRSLMPIQVKSSNAALEIIKANPSSLFFSFTELSNEDKSLDSLRVDKISF